MVFRSPSSPPATASRRRRAFTLIEVLVASGVTVLLVGFIVVIVSNVSNFWTRSSGSLTAGSQARYALDQLTLDLQSALYRDDGGTWLAANIPLTTATSTLWDARNNTVPKPAIANGSLQATTTGNLGDNSITSPRFGQAGVSLRFFTTKRGANTVAGTGPTATATGTVSAPVAVGWQIVRRAASVRVGNLDIRYLLHRAEARPTATAAGRPGTLEAGFSLTAAAYTTNTGTNTGGTTGDPRSLQIPGSATNLDSVIAENVIDFGVRLYSRAANGALTRIFPAGALDFTHAATEPPSSPTPGNRFPEVADVMIRVLTDEGARLIATFEAGRLTAPTGRSNAQYWWDLALANSKVYSRRIVLRAEPL